MIDLDQSQNPIWYNNWPKQSVINTINDETNAAKKINDSNGSDFARQETPNYEYRS
ncbi:hypothetical protein [Soonwooa sp.]|uniref:hypothetical protein n=1 Tax=Soonwooa sp. TaxID=1938592 RepID=UPI003435866F